MTEDDSLSTVPWYSKEDGRVDLLQGLDERALEGVRLSKPAGAGRAHGCVDVQQLCSNMTERKVTDNVLFTRGGVGLL